MKEAKAETTGEELVRKALRADDIIAREVVAKMANDAFNAGKIDKEHLINYAELWLNWIKNE